MKLNNMNKIELIILEFTIGAVLIGCLYSEHKHNVELQGTIDKIEQAYIDNSRTILDTNKSTTATLQLTQKALNQMTDMKEEVAALIASRFNVTNIFKTTIKDSVVFREVGDSLFIDTIQTFYYNDGYFVMNCDLDSDTAYCDYSYTDSVTAITYVHQNYKWWQFKKKRNFVSKYSTLTDVMFKNPKVKIKSVKSIQVTQ
jgi:hypothetical protein